MQTLCPNFVAVDILRRSAATVRVVELSKKSASHTTSASAAILQASHKTVLRMGLACMPAIIGLPNPRGITPL